MDAVCVQTPAGILLADAGSLASHLRARQWSRLSQSQGTKGERLFDWARLPIVCGGRVDGRHFLVVRRSLDEPHDLAYYLVFAPPDTELATMVQVIGARWHIEEDLKVARNLGLDHYEVRSYSGWSRHLTLVLLACAFLLSISVHQPSAPRSPLIPLTGSEIRHLLARLLLPLPSSAPLICHWSRWRRTHQYWAGYYHRRRRAKAR